MVLTRLPACSIATGGWNCQRAGRVVAAFDDGVWWLFLWRVLNQAPEVAAIVSIYWFPLQCRLLKQWRHVGADILFESRSKYCIGATLIGQGRQLTTLGVRDETERGEFFQWQLSLHRRRPTDVVGCTWFQRNTLNIDQIIFITDSTTSRNLKINQSVSESSYIESSILKRNTKQIKDGIILVIWQYYN